MTRFGVKTKSGKVIWVLADAAEVRERVVVFLCHSSGSPDSDSSSATVVAGFNLDVVDHFGRPDAFATENAGDGNGGD